MAINNYSEQNELFKQQTGKDFSFFYKKYYPKLIFFTSKMCGDPQKAEDITSESFMSAFEKINLYHQDKSQFSTWLFTIARNLVLQEIKTSKKSVSMDIQIDEEGTTLKDFICEPEDNTSKNFDVIDKKAEIMLSHISRLKEPYKTVIEMREIKKMAYKDISEELNENLSTIKSRIRIGRLMLVDRTKKEYDILDEMY
ncbi:sigma-70 family RNA polymerase sigma factor [bacterium]|nr:sigma-70 family RNA polymerase sigma factor [bacterium]